MRYIRLQVVEHYINQNNAIDVYQSYFTDPSCQKMQTLAPSFRTMAVMSDPCDPTRPVQHISWSPDQGKLVAVSYADMRFQAANPENSPDSFIFTLGILMEKTIINFFVRVVLF
jgi:dynein intermediate chain 2